ncbi:MAG: single-stranded DNA-binding protein [Bifidobacteriaceae bacterium]|jgi:single-stranded DNA-binding protein|nr:single-stranded DNA-binding protein [Bifidobacteriaceae bacterium]
MTIKTSASMRGFVVTTPALSNTEGNRPRLYMRVGQEHHTRNQDGSFTQNESTFHDLVMFGRAAEKAAAQFAKGDQFVAAGHIHTDTATHPDGHMIEREEFVARRIGHDTAVTNYTVDRTPRRTAQTRTGGAETGRAQAIPRVPDPVRTNSQTGLATWQNAARTVPAVGM